MQSVVRLKVLRFEPVRVVYVPADFLPLRVFVSNIDDRGKLAVSHQLLSLLQCVQQRELGQILVCAGKLLWLRIQLRFARLRGGAREPRGEQRCGWGLQGGRAGGAV